jgi:hypothetical protein
MEEAEAAYGIIDTIQTFKVLGHVAERKRPRPHMVCVTYSKGGHAYYMVTDTGMIDSELLVRLPRQVADRMNPITQKMEKVDFIAITSHKESKGKGIELEVRWKDLKTTFVPILRFAQQAHYEVHRYAIEHKLESQKGWRRYARKKRLQKRKLTLIPSVSGSRKNDISESQKKKSKDAVSEDKNPD